MTHDPYSPCPCGSGKKLKWCCQKLADDMRRVERLIEQDQHTAALTALERLAEKHPDNAWVMTVQTRLYWRGEQREQAEVLIDRLLQTHPGHPAGLLLRALEVMEKEGPQPGLEPAQAALAAGGDPEQLSQLAVAVGLTLADQGHHVAALAHLRLARRLRPDVETIEKLLGRAEQQSDVPEVLRDEYRLKEPEMAGDEHRTAFLEAVACERRGAWAEAAERFEQLAGALPDCKELHYNVGLCRAWLLQYDQAAASLRRYVAREADFDAAVEAEALAQMLNEPPWGGRLDAVHVTYPLRDRDALIGAGEQSDLCVQVDANDENDESDQTEQNVTFLLLDRPVGEWREGIAPDELASVLGMFEIARRDSDGNGEIARFMTVGDGLASSARERFEQMAGDAVGEAEDEETVAAASGDRHPVQIRWELPKRTSRSEYHRLVDEERRRYLQDDWPDLKLARFDGRTPREAANEPRHRVALAAMLLLFAQKFFWDPLASTLQSLRHRLGLDPDEARAAEEAQIENLPLSRLGRLAVGQLSDTALLGALQRASRFAILPAELRLGDEVMRRDTLLQRVDFGMLCAELSRVSHALFDTQSALGYIKRGRELDRRYGRDLCGFWDLQEIPMQLYAVDRAKVEALLQHTAEEHRDDESVQRALGQILAAFGLLPEQTPERPEEPAILVPGGERPGQLWTPGQDQPQRGAPKLWTPGDA